MPSAQINSVVETEKQAWQIEQDAKDAAKGIAEAAVEDARARVSAIKVSADAQIKEIENTTREQSEQFMKEEEERVAKIVADLQKTAADNRVSAIKSAVQILSGKA